MSLMMCSEAFYSFNRNSTSTQPLTCIVMANTCVVQLGDLAIIKSYKNNEAVNIVRLLIVKVSVSERWWSKACK